MKPAKTIIRFFVLLGLAFTLLMLPLPGVRQIYARFFRATNQFMLGSFGRDGMVAILPRPMDGSAFDCDVILANRAKGTRVSATFSSDVGYTPTAFLTALLIATPLPLRRRMGAFLWGMLLVHAVVGLTLLLQITFLFGSNPLIATFSLSEFSQRTLAELTRLVLFAPFFSMVVPTFIWILVTFRTEDLTTIVRSERWCRSA